MHLFEAHRCPAAAIGLDNEEQEVIQQAQWQCSTAVGPREALLRWQIVLRKHQPFIVRCDLQLDVRYGASSGVVFREVR